MATKILSFLVLVFEIQEYIFDHTVLNVKFKIAKYILLMLMMSLSFFPQCSNAVLKSQFLKLHDIILNV